MHVLRQDGYTANNQPAIAEQDILRFTLVGDPLLGIPLSAVEAKDLVQLLKEAETLLPDDLGQKASFRILVSGYRPFAVQKNVRRIRGGKSTPITCAQIVKVVADVVAAFIQEAQGRTSPGEYRFGPGHIELHHIRLLELRRVAKASFQPVLGIVRD